MGQSQKFLTVTFKQAYPLARYWMEVRGLYLLTKASYSQFCVEICDFTYTDLLAVPDNPTLEPKIMTLSYAEPEL